MIAWSPDALERFHRRCEDRRASLLALDADPDEVFADWKALVESRAATAGETEVSDTRIQSELDALLSAAGELPPPNAAPPAPPSVLPSAMRIWFGRVSTFLLWTLGVALPLGVLLFELIAGLCAEIFFDPLPTWMHTLLIALVPLSNAWALLASSRAYASSAAGRHFRWIGLLNGAAIGVSAYYALQFAIFTPFAALAVVYMGIGLVPLAPLLSFASAIVLRARLRRARFLTSAPPLAAGWRSALPAFLLMLLLAIPQSIVQIGAARANDSDPAVRTRAVRLLRLLGDRDTLLRKCYRPGENIDLSSLALAQVFGFSPSAEDAQKAYYRVTGTPYNAVRPPRIKGFRGQSLLDDDWFDPALGGDQVAARVKGLSLSQSRLDGRIDSSSGIAYLEWTMEFRNDSKTQREARALVELPPGAVVSRVTLWINDEPCEAAFGGRSQTKQAYQQVAVRQRRDPVLVTTAGPDRVLLQCFPVPVGGSMKTRIGITAPLLVPNAEKAEALLRLPAFAEQNFTAAPNQSTAVWIESDVAAASPLLHSIPQETQFAVRGKIPADADSAAEGLHMPLPLPFPPVVSRDARLPDGHAILQTLERPEGKPTFPTALAIVLDGSSRMKAHHAHVVKCVFDLIPPETAVRTFIARDQPDIVDGKPPFSIRYVGGCDNVPALLQAAEWAAANGNPPILWLHAAQPLESSDLEALRQIADFSRGKLAIHSLQYGPGADRVSEKLADLDLVHPLPILGDHSLEVVHFLSGLSARWHREKISADAIPADTPEGSTHVARLWAADEIARLSSPHRKSGGEEAVELARTFQLVTPVSGAVVLETAAQYKAHGLTPVDPASTPGIVPEPGTLGLLLLGAPLLLSLRRRKIS